MTLLDRLATNDRRRGRLGRHSVMLASLVFMVVALPILQWLPTRGLRFPVLFVLVFPGPVQPLPAPVAEFLSDRVRVQPSLVQPLGGRHRGRIVVAQVVPP